jgi:hypothetical protein
MSIRGDGTNETLREWFDYFTEQTGEQIETVQLVASGYRWREQMEGWPELPTPATPVADADFLDTEFDAGFGGEECPMVYGWSPSFVLYKHEYDGSESPMWARRNPPTEVTE